MSGKVRRPFWLALALSLMLHLFAFTVPGWRLPLPDEEETPEVLAATLLSAPVPVQAQPKAAPPPQKRVRHRPRSAPLVPSIATSDAPASEVVPEAAPEVVPDPDPAPIEAATPVAVPLAPTFTYANLWPRTGRIVFQVTRGDGGLIVGQSEHRWTHDEQNYTLHAVAETVGLAALFRPARVTQSSRGRFAVNGLRPEEFKTERDGKPKDSINFSALQDEVWPVQDMLSLFYQLGAAALDVPEFTVKIQTGRKLTTFVVQVGETQPLDLPLGTYTVRHLKVAGGRNEDSTEIWLDTLSRLPLKIRHRDRKGEVFDQTATTINLENTE